jgi:hypothetical protein
MFAGMERSINPQAKCWLSPRVEVTWVCLGPHGVWGRPFLYWQVAGEAGRSGSLYSSPRIMS